MKKVGKLGGDELKVGMTSYFQLYTSELSILLFLKKIIDLIILLFSLFGQIRQKIAVTPLEEGPFISYAEYFKIDDKYPYVEKGNGCDCPKSETQVVVRTVWSGGVRSKEGEEIGEAELSYFHVTLIHENDTIEVNPFKIADTNDNENNIDLCIKELGTPISVRADANIAIDPRDDLNPVTKMKILSRW